MLAGGIAHDFNNILAAILANSQLTKMMVTAGEHVTKNFDVILDLTIPGGMGGKETMGRLLEFDPKIIAIVSSGYFNDPIMADYRRFGFSGVLKKPFDFKDLINLLGYLIGAK